MLWQTVLIPYLAEQPKTQDLWFVRNYTERQINLYPRQETIIRENEAVTEAIKKVEGSVALIKGRTASGSALIYTTDGLIVAFSELAPVGGSFTVWVDGQEVDVSVKKRDVGRGLVLLKAEAQGLSTVPFVSLENIEKGERVFVIGANYTEDGPVRVVNEGIVREVREGFIYTNMKEGQYMQGSVLFDIEGRVIGINRIGLDGDVISVPVRTLEEFLST